MKYLQEGNFIKFDGHPGVDLGIGDVVHLSGNNEVNRADSASGSTAYPAIGLVFEYDRNMDIVTVVTDGVLSDAVTGGWTYGQRIYLGTDGTLTNTKPSDVGTIVQLIGVAKNATDLLLNINSEAVVN